MQVQSTRPRTPAPGAQRLAMTAFIAAASFAVSASASDALIAYWNFNALDIPGTGSTSFPGDGVVPLTIDADYGSGVISLEDWDGAVQNFAGNEENALFDDPAGASLSLQHGSGSLNGNNTWIEFELSMAGYENLFISYWSRKTGTGFNANQWSWSSDGFIFTPFDSVIDPVDSTTGELITVAAPDAINNADFVYLRYTLNGATSAAGNNRIDNLQLRATPIPAFDVTIELPYLDDGEVQRCIAFTLVDTDGFNDPLEIAATITFIDGIGAATITLPEGESLNDYDCITARDPLHTLSRSQNFDTSGTIDFAGSFALLGGDLNDDNVIDIIDFSIYVWQFGADYSDSGGGAGDADCDTPYPHADMTGSGLVEAADFTVLFANFFEAGEACPVVLAVQGRKPAGPTPRTPEPRRSITVRELRDLGLGHLIAADLNGDGVVDQDDVVAFLIGASR